MKIDPGLLRRVWSIVLSKAPSAAPFLSMEKNRMAIVQDSQVVGIRVLRVKSLRIAHFENSGTGLGPANFLVEVSFGNYGYNRTDIIPPELTNGVDCKAQIRIDTGDLGEMEKFPGYEDLLRGLDDPIRFETKVAHGLYHEVLHAIIRFQGQAGWPSKYRGGLRRMFEDFMRDAKHGELRDSRLDIKKPFDLLYLLMKEEPPDFDEQLDGWLNEVFAGRESFSAFGVVVTNAQWAHRFAWAIGKSAQKRVEKGLQVQREIAFKQLEKTLLAFLNRLDKVNRPNGRPAQPKPSPWQWSKGRLTPWGIADRPPIEYVPRDPYSPRVLPWPGSRPFGNNTPKPVFRNNVLSPPTTSILPAIPKPWQPPSVAPTPVAPYATPQPWAPPASMGLPPLNAQPSVPAFAAGPFNAIEGPPSWAVSRPEPFQASGSGWDPNRFGFSDPISQMTLPPTVVTPIQANPWESESKPTTLWDSPLDEFSPL